MPDDKLQKYFMDQTNKQLEDLKTEVKAIHGRFDDLMIFKAGIQLNARWISMLVSGAFGLAGLAISTGLTIYLSRLERQALLDAAHLEVKQQIEAKASGAH